MNEKPQIFINPKSGSIRISGDVDFIDADGIVIRSESNVKLCGCGHSKDKPYCDGSHKELRQEKKP
jgi:CDGSH-type Zn-finger protein